MCRVGGWCSRPFPYHPGSDPRPLLTVQAPGRSTMQTQTTLSPRLNSIGMASHSSEETPNAWPSASDILRRKIRDRLLVHPSKASALMKWHIFGFHSENNAVFISATSIETLLHHSSTQRPKTLTLSALSLSLSLSLFPFSSYHLSLSLSPFIISPFVCMRALCPCVSHFCFHLCALVSTFFFLLLSLYSLWEC